MRFGMFSIVDHYPQELDRSISSFYKELLEQAEAADKMGFHSFWVAEHHFHQYGVVPRPAIILAAVAARTSRLRLGSAVAVLPFDNPVRVAEDYAMLDQLSAGRLEFGAGSGYLQHEYDGFGLDQESRRERFDESLALIRRCWSGDTISFLGQHFECRNVKLNVLPMQEPEPPVFVAVLRNEAAHFVGKQMLGLMMIPYAATESLAELTQVCKAYEDAYQSAAKTVEAAKALKATKPGDSATLGDSAKPGDFAETAAAVAAAAAAEAAEAASVRKSLRAEALQRRVQFGLHCYCAADTEQARAFARPYMERYVKTRLFAKQRSFDELLEKDLIAIGNPEEIMRIARRYQSAGLTDFLMIMNFGGMPHEAVLESMKLVSENVLPEFASTMEAMSR